MYYALILLSTLMFGVQFMFNGRYQARVGASMLTSMIFAAGMGIIGTAALMLINGFGLTLTPFTFLMALASAVNSILFTVCSIYAFRHINLSLYSVFSMVGGMLLPFIAGICFFNEGISAAKVLCIVTLFAALCVTVEKGKSSGGWPFYIGVFFFNGMGALLAVLFSKGDYPKGSSADYLIAAAILKALLSAAAAAAVILIGKRKAKAVDGGSGLKKYFSPIPLLFVGLCGVLSYLANYILQIALEHEIPASLQYLLVTGGVLVCSTVLGFFSGKKPGTRDLVSVGMCIAGMLMLFLPF